MKLTPSQIKFLIIKGFHLLTAIAIILLLVVYCHYKQDSTSQATSTENQSSSKDIVESAYQQFCENNQDMGCGKIENFVTEDAVSSQVILMDTNEIDEDWVNQIAKIASLGAATDVNPQNAADLLDKIYEEKLPDNVIEPKEKTKSSDLKIKKDILASKEPLVVIVIDDMGISQKHTAEISSLKYPLTTAYLTYGKKIESDVEKSRDSGQEIILHTPMEPQKKAETAPDTLTTSMSTDEIKANLKQMLAKVPHIVGINNHMGSKLTEDYDRMVAVMEILKEQNLFFLDSKTSAKSRAEEAAQRVGVPYAHRHVFLDNNNDKNYILGQLKQLEKLANKNGYGIAIGHPKSGTYEALKEWLPKLQDKGLKLVHLSDVISILNF